MGHVVDRIWYLPVLNFCLSAEETIPTLWSTIRTFTEKYPTYVAEDNAHHFMVDDPTKGLDGKYNLCHVSPLLILYLMRSSGRTLRSRIYDGSDPKCIQITLNISTKQEDSSTRDGAMLPFTVSQQHSSYRKTKSISFMILDIGILRISDVLRTKNLI